jgi:hypothetical protein
MTRFRPSELRALQRGCLGFGRLTSWGCYVSTCAFKGSVRAVRKNRAMPIRTQRHAFRPVARLGSRAEGWQRSTLIALAADHEYPLAGDRRPSRVSPRGLGCGDRGRASSALAGAGWHRRPPVNLPVAGVAGRGWSVAARSEAARARSASVGTPAPCPLRRACAVRASLAGRRLGRTVRCAGLDGDIVTPPPLKLAQPAPPDLPAGPIPDASILLSAPSRALLLTEASARSAVGASKPWPNTPASVTAGDWPADKRWALDHLQRAHKRLRRTVPEKLLRASVAPECFHFAR